MVTVYSTPGCIQCTATTNEMNRRNIEHNVVDLTKDEKAYQMVSDLGYKQAPIVMAGDDHWSGFRPDKIGSLIPA